MVVSFCDANSKTRRFALALLNETTSCVKDYITFSFVAGSCTEQRTSVTPDV